MSEEATIDPLRRRIDEQLARLDADRDGLSADALAANRELHRALLALRRALDEPESDRDG